MNRPLEATGDSLAKICSALGAATSREGMREVFRRFDAVIHMLTRFSAVADTLFNRHESS